tara:strand:- start:414 stop:1205 length:792 start_codon:yes stop_codon:yes gene_type:complete
MTTTLHHGDCLEKMKLIPDKSVDLIICDLPYGCLIGGAGKDKIYRADNPDKPNNRKEGVIAGCSWDIKIDLEPFWREVKRIRKNEHTPCIHFCSTKFGIDLINSNPKEYRYDLVWNKMRGVGFFDVNKKPMSGHEMIYVFSKKGANYNRIDVEGEPYTNKRGGTSNHYSKVELTGVKNTGTRCIISVINLNNKMGTNKNGHPTAKPLDLYKWLISRYSNEGDTVLDPTFGSGNSGLVCKELNRNYIGIEMNQEFFDKAREKMN